MKKKPTESRNKQCDFPPVIENYAHAEGQLSPQLADIDVEVEALDKIKKLEKDNQTLYSTNLFLKRKLERNGLSTDLGWDSSIETIDPGTSAAKGSDLDPIVIINDCPQPDGSVQKFLSVDWGYSRNNQIDPNLGMPAPPTREEVSAMIAAALRRFQEEHPQESLQWFSDVDKTLDYLDTENYRRKARQGVHDQAISELQGAVGRLNKESEELQAQITDLTCENELTVDWIRDADARLSKLEQKFGNLDILADGVVENLVDHVNREIGVAQDVPLHERLKNLDEWIDGLGESLATVTQKVEELVYGRLAAVEKRLGFLDKKPLSSLEKHARIRCLEDQVAQLEQIAQFPTAVFTFNPTAERELVTAAFVDYLDQLNEEKK